MFLLKRLMRVLALRAPTLSGGWLATTGLVAALALMPALVFWGALENYHAGIASKQAIEASDAFQQARYSVGAEESLERKYRLEPGQEIREQHARAAANLVSWLGKARSLDQGENVIAIDDVLAKHAAYLSAIVRLFSAVDANDTARATAI